MADPDLPTRNQRIVSVSKRTGASFLWKLIIVAAGIGAYFALNAMEATKTKFYQTKTASLVIVDTLQVQPSDVIELSAQEVRDFMDPNKNTQIVANYDKAFVDNLKLYVDRVKYQPVQNSQELLDRMNQEIRNEEAAAERVSEQQLDILERQYAARKAALFEKCPLPAESMSTIAKAENAATNSKPPVIKPCPQSLPSAASCEQIITQFSCWSNNYAAQKRGQEDKDKYVSQTREAQVKAIYEYVRPQLISRVNQIKKDRQVHSFAYLFPGNVLDERNGSHVIFSIFWLTCMVILIFGVLFVILLLLRPFPPFAGGTEALSDQAKSFLSRRFGAPEIAKTAIAATTALGIGTAVAVASSMNMPNHDTNPPSSRVVQNIYDNSQSGNKPGSISKPPILNVTLASPPPVAPNVYVASADSRKVDDLTTAYGELNRNFQMLTQNYNTLKSEVGTTLGRIDSAMDQKVQPLGTQLISVTDELAHTKSDLQELKADATTLKNDFITRIDLLNSSILDSRNDDLSQLRIPAHRNLFTKTLSLFKVNGERYLVTMQSYLALRRLMCVKKVYNRPGTCAVDGKCDCDQNNLVDKLRDLIGTKPVTESEFSEMLSNADATAWQTWKAIILRYTRVV